VQRIAEGGKKKRTNITELPHIIFLQLSVTFYVAHPETGKSMK
jgi:hypothetical protein